MKTCVIFNPSAGSVSDREAIGAKLRSAATAVFSTSETGDATRLTREAVDQGFELIVAAGGDGTLNEVVNGLGPRAGAARVALVPLGTGNDFARTLGLPSSIDECLELVRAGQTKALDLVRVTSDQTRYFINVSAGGFSGTVNEKMTPELKQSWGPLAYLRSAAAALPELKAYATAIVLDGVDRLEVSAYNIVLGNGRYVAGGIPIAPEAVADDGLLDLIIIPELPAADLAIIAAQILLGGHLSNEKIIFRRAAKVTVDSRPGMWFNADGELVGNEPAVFEVLPKAIQFVVGNL